MDASLIDQNTLTHKYFSFTLSTGVSFLLCLLHFNPKLFHYADSPEDSADSTNKGYTKPPKGDRWLKEGVDDFF